jgi:hypothetical protein
VPVDAGSLHYAVGPFIVLLVLALLGLFMRWAFGTGGSRPARRASRPEPADDGLLARIATLSRRESALALRAVLSDAGIRSTIREAGDRRSVVLVFPEDAERARALAISFDGRERG